jgi:tRNA(Ile)-lysidine synthase
MNLEITQINTTKNLLAFSGGIDSSALFFLLLENNILFDIAIVDYNVREQSKQEVAYAKELAKKYNKQIFIKDINIDSSSNFEKNARDIRYTFFENLIYEYNYDTLITAHQLNDKLEWFLMQMCKGAGLAEVISFEEFSKKLHYTLFRPLLNISKDELENYLKKNDIKYFVDETNFDEKYTRNYFRKNFSNKLLEDYKNGIKNSFDYLQNDLNSLDINSSVLFKEKELEIFTTNIDNNINIRIIDKSLKKRGILLSKAQREEILKQKEIVISHKISVNLTNKYIFIAPYKNETLNKKFKEKCRVNKIPKNIRVYIFLNDLIDNIIKTLD